MRQIEFARIGLGICYDIRFPEMAMIAARKGESGSACIHASDQTRLLIGVHVMIYPGAFNLTTGPLHWELLQRARFVFVYVSSNSEECKPCDRAVDNQIFVSTCSPARDMSAGYHAVSVSDLIQLKLLTRPIQWGHSMVVDPM